LPEPVSSVISIVTAPTSASWTIAGIHTLNRRRHVFWDFMSEWNCEETLRVIEIIGGRMIAQVVSIQYTVEGRQRTLQYPIRSWLLRPKSDQKAKDIAVLVL